MIMTCSEKVTFYEQHSNPAGNVTDGSDKQFKGFVNLWDQFDCFIFDTMKFYGIVEVG